MADPERAPLVRRAFEEYATGRFTKEQLLKQARAWGLTNRRGRPLTSQAIGVLLRNQLYAGIVDVREYGVRGKRGDFEPLISEDLFYRIQAVLSGASTEAPATRAPGFPSARFVRCESADVAHRQLVERPQGTSPEVPLRECATGPGLQIALEFNSPLLVGEFDGDVEVPRAVPRGVRAAAGVVVGESGVDVRGETDVEVSLRIGTLENVDESLVFGHPKAKARSAPDHWNAERAVTMGTRPHRWQPLRSDWR